MTPSLWPPQVAAVNAVELTISAGSTSGLIVLPTGTGKTGMVLSLGRRLGVPLLFLVHREELLGQTLRAAHRFWPEAHATAIAAGTSTWDEPDLATGRRPDLVVAMVPSLINRLGSIAADRFGLVVADEAHYSVAPTWCAVLDHFRPGFLLGVTATPQRLDGKGLASRYGREPLYSYSLYQAIKDGRLVPVDPRQAQTGTDLDGLETEEAEDGERDFRTGQLARAVNNGQRNDLVVAAWQRDGQGRRAVAFCVDVAHALALAAAFRAAGSRCEAVTGRMPGRDRRQVLADFSAGKYDVLTNCEVLTTGFDDPGLSCLLMARPTESRSLYIQMVGRGLRLLGASYDESVAAGKSTCLVIDFTDNCSRHKLVSVLDLLGKKSPLQNGPAEPRDQDEERPYQPDLPLPPLVNWTLQTVCPWPELPSLAGYVPLLSWHNDPASEAQLRSLASFGLAPREDLSKGEASYLLDRALEYDAAHPLPATERQRRYLEDNGLWTDGMGKRQASALIGQLKKARQRKERPA